jgi:hypothetical protein
MVTKIAKLQMDKVQEVEIPPSVTVTRFKVIPRLVNGRIELHYEELPDESRVVHHKTPADNSCHP